MPKNRYDAIFFYVSHTDGRLWHKKWRNIKYQDDQDRLQLLRKIKKLHPGLTAVNIYCNGEKLHQIRAEKIT